MRREGGEVGCLVLGFRSHINRMGSRQDSRGRRSLGGLRPVNQYGYIRAKEEEQVTWWFTPSQPVRLYEGKGGRASNLVVYAQSTSTVI